MKELNKYQNKTVESTPLKDGEASYWDKLLFNSITPIRYFYINNIRLTHPDWINFSTRYK